MHLFLGNIEYELLPQLVQSSRPHNVFSMLHSKGTFRARRGRSKDTWPTRKIRDAVMKHCIQNNNCVGVKARLAVRVDETTKVDIKIRPGRPLGSFFVVEYQVQKESYKFGHREITSRVMF